MEYPLTQKSPSSSDTGSEGEDVADTSNNKRKVTNDVKEADKKETTQQEDANKKMKMKEFFRRACTINFSKKCPHCGEVICDSTTMLTFIQERINFTSICKKTDAHKLLLDTYLLLKDFEKFQQTRYTDPETVSKHSKLPQCVLKTFKQYMIEETPYGSTFNQCRRRLMEIDEEDED